MHKGSYERYGLSGNPFRDLSSDSIEHIEIFNVKQDFDQELDLIKEDVFSKENKTFVVIMGKQGTGKTHRLLVTQYDAERFDYFSVLNDIDKNTQWVVLDILDSIINTIKKRDFFKAFSAPKWYQNLTKTKKLVQKKAYNPRVVGRVIADALNQNRPACLLLNDFGNLKGSKDLNKFLYALHVIADHVLPGVLIMINTDPEFFKALMEKYPSLNSRITVKYEIKPLSDSEAGLLLAKRMLDKRLVDDIEPIYPFTEEALATINKEAEGNPRRLLKLAGYIVDYAAQQRAMTINENLVKEILKIGKNKRLDASYQEPVEEKVEEPKKKSKKKVKPKKSKTPIPTANPKPLGNPYPIGNPGSNPRPAGNPNPSSNPGNPGPVKKVKAKCPKCKEIFTFEKTPEVKKIECPNPNCSFVGNIGRK